MSSRAHERPWAINLPIGMDLKSITSTAADVDSGWQVHNFVFGTLNPQSDVEPAALTLVPRLIDHGALRDKSSIMESLERELDEALGDYVLPVAARDPYAEHRAWEEAHLGASLRVPRAGDGRRLSRYDALACQPRRT